MADFDDQESQPQAAPTVAPKRKPAPAPKRPDGLLTPDHSGSPLAHNPNLPKRPAGLMTPDLAGPKHAHNPGAAKRPAGLMTPDLAGQGTSHAEATSRSMETDQDLVATLMGDVRIGMAAAKRLREQILPAFSTLAEGGKPSLAMPELEARAQLRKMTNALDHVAIYVENAALRLTLSLPDELIKDHATLGRQHAELKARTDALARQNAERVKAEQARAKQPAAPPHSYSEHIAAPPRFDFGKIIPGGTGQTEGPIFNLSPAACAVQVSYAGSPAIHLLQRPTHLAGKGEQRSLPDQMIKLQFDAPATKSSHHGTVTVSVSWWGGPPPDTLTIPVEAHAMDLSDDTPDEKAARDQRARQDAAEADRAAKRDAEDQKKRDAFQRRHPMVDTDRFNDLKDELKDVLRELEVKQLSGVTTAEGEVLKYKKRPPPLRDGALVFDLAMLALDIATAGIAGKLGKALEIGLKAAKSEVAAELGKQIVLSDTTVALITDTVKEAIKGSSKLARKNLAPRPPKPGAAVGGNPAPAAGESADPRLAFFEDQRNGLGAGQTTRSEGVRTAWSRLRPTLHATPELAYAAMKRMIAAFRAQLTDASHLVAHESVRQWVNLIAQEQIDVHHAGSVDSRPINPIDAVIDIGFQAPYGPSSPIIIKHAIIRGVSNAIARRFQNLRLGAAGVPIRAYGLPGGNYAELPVAVLYGRGGRITWEDQTNGLAPASAATWLQQKGGANQFMEREILNKSLTQHGVVLTTDQDPSLEGG